MLLNLLQNMFGQRYYDPVTGRFISADTIVPDPFDTQSYNRYSYVKNNPVRYSDPSGHYYYEPDPPPPPNIVPPDLKYGAPERYDMEMYGHPEWEPSVDMSGFGAGAAAGSFVYQNELDYTYTGRGKIAIEGQDEGVWGLGEPTYNDGQVSSYDESYDAGFFAQMAEEMGRGIGAETAMEAAAVPSGPPAGAGNPPAPPDPGKPRLGAGTGGGGTAADGQQLNLAGFPNPIQGIKDIYNNIDILRRTIYGESRSTPEAMEYVGWIMKNRANDWYKGNYEKAKRGRGGFDVWRPSDPNYQTILSPDLSNPIEKKAWDAATKAAIKVYFTPDFNLFDPTDGAKFMNYGGPHPYSTTTTTTECSWYFGK